MLVLIRQKNESVIIGDNIKIIVLGMSELGISLGFDAPRYIPVHREEIYLRNKIGNFNKLINSQLRNTYKKLDIAF